MAKAASSKESKASQKTSSGKTLSVRDELITRPLGEPRYMPQDFSISLGNKGGTDQQLLNPGKDRRQSMRGFEDTYVDIIDYIVRITHRIWEEKDIGYIYDTYSHSSNVYDDYGLQYGRDKIVADTVHTINAFPDIRLFADEIVWAGDDEVGFHTSHRVLITGHNTGYSKYGPPTGRKINCWCIANCVALNNEIFHEWVIYDTASLIAQLGFDVREKARVFGNELSSNLLQDEGFGNPERLPGQGKPPLLTYKASFNVEDFIRVTYHNIWNRRMLGTVRQAYAPALQFLGSTGRSYQGRSEYQAFILSLMAMFPDLALSVDDVYHMGNDEEGYLTSVRWSITGTHRGYGIYGQPTGRQVNMWGISQHEIRNGIITKEWTLFNEFAVMQQIYRD